MENLVIRALDQGYTVEFLPLAKHSGLVMPGNRILVNSRKSRTTQRAALAHELGHIFYGHDWRFPHEHSRDELKADRFAADLLIDPASYAVAEVMHDGVISAVAAELEVPVSLLTIWQRIPHQLAQHLDA